MELSDLKYLERLFEAFYEVGALPGGGVTRLGYTALEDEMHRRFGALAEAPRGRGGAQWIHTIPRRMR